MLKDGLANTAESTAYEKTVYVSLMDSFSSVAAPYL